jgi:thiosulfate dehydrogenase (quinone) large subunit
MSSPAAPTTLSAMASSRYKEDIMSGSLTYMERGFRGLLGLFLAFVAYNVDPFGHGSMEPTLLAWGAAIVAAIALVTAVAGTAGPLSRVGLDASWSLVFLSARLYVGWEFLYAGWMKATSGWYSHAAGTAEVKGILAGAVASSHPSAQDPFPPVSHWFGWLAANHLAPHAHVIGYLVVTGELAVGAGLILGLFVRLSAFFGVTLNSLFMFAGALGAGLSPEMVVMGMLVLVSSSAAVYALSVDRYALPLLRSRIPDVTHIGHHAPAH